MGGQMTPERLPFDVKPTEDAGVDLLNDPVKGYARIHPDALEILEYICEFSRQEWNLRPMVTEFGRTRNDMERIYAPSMLQALEHMGVRETFAGKQAIETARGRFSWHVIDTVTGYFRAFDLRDRIYTEPQRVALIATVRQKFHHAEALHHTVQGNDAWHFHFGAPDSLGRPTTWV